MIRDSNYITILAPMITKLELKGNELLIFALIHGFSQDGESTFKGSIRYLTKWTGLNRTTVIAILKSLTDKEFLEKTEEVVKRVKKCEYRSLYYEALERSENTTTPPVGKSDYPQSENTTAPPVGKSDPILIDNNRDITIKEKPETNVSGSLFPDDEIEKKEKVRGTSENLCLFKNSKFALYEDFEKQFKSPEFEIIDINFYYNAVADWSSSKGAKKKDWIATARNFMRSDKTKGKLQLLNQQNGKTNMQEALNYLKEFD